MARDEAMFSTVFAELKAIMQAHEEGLVVKADREIITWTPGHWTSTRGLSSSARSGSIRIT